VFFFTADYFPAWHKKFIQGPETPRLLSAAYQRM
jgi:hypothetical protein